MKIFWRRWLDGIFYAEKRRSEVFNAAPFMSIPAQAGIFVDPRFRGNAAEGVVEITLVQATCLFVISYVVAPTDGDRYEGMIKGIAEDIGYTRANLEYQNTKDKP